MASKKREGKPKRRPKPIRPKPTQEGAKFPLVCIGASAGGLEAFIRLLESLPASTGMGYVIIQHLDPSHPSVLPPRPVTQPGILAIFEVREIRAAA